MTDTNVRTGAHRGPGPLGLWAAGTATAAALGVFAKFTPGFIGVLFLAPVGGAVHLVAIHRWVVERSSKTRVRSERRLTSALG